MKNLVFETIELEILEKGETRLTMVSHSGTSSMTMTFEELEILIGCLLNKRALALKSLEKDVVRVNLMREERKKK